MGRTTVSAPFGIAGRAARLGAVGRSAALQIRDFRLLFVANTVSLVGNAFTNVALAFGVLAATHKTGDIGIVIAFRTVAQVVFTLVGGTWADRMSRRTLLIITSIASAATQLAVSTLFLTHHASVWNLALLTFCNGASTAFASPAATGILPQVVPDDLLGGANALWSISRNAATIAGASVAGGLVAATSPGWALLIDAGSYLGCAGLVALMAPTTASSQRVGMWSELVDGWREFVTRTWVWTIVVQFTILNMAASAGIIVFAPVAAKVDLGGPASYGLMDAALGIGGLAGGFLMLRLSPRRPLVAGTIAVLFALTEFVALAAKLPLAAVLPACAATGIAIAVFDVLWATAIQRHIPRDRISRVSAYDTLGSTAFVPIGLLLAGPAETAFGGLHGALWATAVSIAAPTLLVLLVPSVRQLTNEPRSSDVSSGREDATAG